MFEVNVPNRAVGEAVEVIDKVEEPGVDAKVVEGRIADIDPDLARSQLLEEPPGAAKEARQRMIILPENVLTKRLTRLPLKKSSLIR